MNAFRLDPEKFMVRRKFLYLDLTGLMLFSLFVVLAVLAARRRDFALHLRLMACTTLIPMEAAIERLLGNTMPARFPDFEASLQGALFFMEAVLVGLIIGERSWRTVRWPFPTLLAYYLFMHVTMGWVIAQPWFQAFGFWFGNL